MGRNLASLCALIFLCSAPYASAAPTLRLVVPETLQLPNGGVQPVWVVSGTDGPAGLSIEAVNDGDGELALSVSGGAAAWLTPSISGTVPCSFDGSRTCTVIAVVFALAGRPDGTYDGQVIVSDANAVDAPQRVSVRVYLGTNVPASLSLYVPPVLGRTGQVEFQTAGGDAPFIAKTSAGSFLSVTSSGLGSARSFHTHQIVGTYREGLPEGANDGSFTVSVSSFEADNRTVPVTLNVTNAPIASTGVSKIEFFTNEGVAGPHRGVIRFVVLQNNGNGTLEVSGVDAETVSGGDWLSVQDLGDGLYQATANGDGLAAGLYEGTLRFNSNAANAPSTVTAVLTVEAAGGPELNFHGVVNGASFSPTQPLGPGLIGTVFGTNLASSELNASVTPLPRELGGAKIMVNGIEAPLFFSSYSQVNFQVPFETPLGNITIQAMRDGQMGNSISANVDGRSAGIFRIGIGEYGIITNFTQGNFPLPTALGAASGLVTAPARTGDVLVIWCTGLGSVSPSVETGAASSASPFLSFVDSPPLVIFGLSIAPRPETPDFAGLSPGLVALYQVNVVVPQMSTNDRLPLTLQFADGRRSKTVEIAYEQ